MIEFVKRMARNEWYVDKNYFRIGIIQNTPEEYVFRPFSDLILTADDLIVIASFLVKRNENDTF